MLETVNHLCFEEETQQLWDRRTATARRAVMLKTGCTCCNNGAAMSNSRKIRRRRDVLLEWMRYAEVGRGGGKMDPSKTGRLIAKQRRVQNLTQEQLAQRIGVSNKTISKWENGKGMPDYALIQPLCEALDIRISELIEGDVQQPCGDEERLMDLLRRTQELERQNKILYGILLIVLGIAMQALSHSFYGSAVQDFLSGALMGISVGVMLIGLYVMFRR